MTTALLTHLLVGLTGGVIGYKVFEVRLWHARKMRDLRATVRTVRAAFRFVLGSAVVLIVVGLVGLNLLGVI